MKLILIAAALPAFLFGRNYLIRNSANPTQMIDAHRIGDVIYSILPPDQFQKEHGDGWDLLDGSPLKESDAIKRYYSPANLPDGRGVFIRSMNMNRDPSAGDQDGNRAHVGDYQRDGLKKHTHPIPIVDFWGAGNVYLPAIAPRNPDPNRAGSEVNPDGIDETRPRNIALYLYVKVN